MIKNQLTIFLYLSVVLCMTLSTSLSAQSCTPDPYAAQMSWWMGDSFGSPKTRVRIDFQGDPVTAVLNNPDLGVFGHGDSGLGFEGHAGATNPETGEFLFATDGNSVYRASDGVKATGGGIGGHNSAGESAAIIPDPQGVLGKDFIVFGNTAYNTDIGRLNAGKYNLDTNQVLGITTLLANDAVQGIAEALEVIPKPNGTDYWILVYSVQNYLRVYEYTAASGFNPTYISQVSVPSPIDPNNYIQAYISWIPQQENKIIVGRQTNIGLVDFDRTTGAVSNYQVKVTTTDDNTGYSTALSPNGRYIYYNDKNAANTAGYLKYLDLQTSTTTTIHDVTGASYIFSMGGFKVGPDGRLYWSMGGSLHYIDDADNPPTGPGSLQTFDTGGRRISIQLPNNTYWACSVTVCQAGDVAPSLASTTITTNPATVADLIASLYATNQPANTVISIHSASPAIDANKLAPTDPVTFGTTYYVSFWDEFYGCYSPTTAVEVFCGGLDSDDDGIPDACDLDDDNDGILDTDEGQCATPLRTTVWTFVGTTATSPTTGVTFNSLPVSGSTNISYTSGGPVTGAFNAVNFWYSTGIAGSQSLQFVHTWDTSPATNQNEPANTDGGTRQITITFPNPVNKVLLNVDRMGGNARNPADPPSYPYISNSAEFAVATPGMVLSKLAGNTQFVVTSTKFYREPDVNLGYAPAPVSEANNTTGNGAGTIEIKKTDGSYFTSVTFDVIGVGPEGVGSDGIEMIIQFCEDLDTDGDGIPNHLDLDSDNDGCPDAVEGDENVTQAHLNPDGSINIDDNDGINTDGVPNLVNSGGTSDIGDDVGQGIGTSQDETENSCYCVEDPNTEDPEGFTKVGISTLASQLTGWPETIPNGFITMESHDKGFVITRVAHVGGGTDGAPDLDNDAIADPKEGMIVYDIQDECVKLFNGTIWNCIERSCND